jgi:hypothetical protein
MTELFKGRKSSAPRSSKFGKSEGESNGGNKKAASCSVEGNLWRFKLLK